MISTLLMDQTQLNRTIRRLAHEIIERNGGCSNLVLVGIMQKGLPLMNRLALAMESVEGKPVPTYCMDISPFRDDHKKTINTNQVSSRPNITGKTVVVVDDVLHTGRSVRAALDGVMKWGRPEAIQLAVLIDRGHRELPIRADFVGKNIPTSRNEKIRVYLDVEDQEDQVVLLKSLENTEIL